MPKKNYEEIKDVVFEKEPPEYRKYGLHGYDLFVDAREENGHYVSTVLRFNTMDDMVIYMKLHQ